MTKKRIERKHWSEIERVAAIPFLLVTFIGDFQGVSNVAGHGYDSGSDKKKKYIKKQRERNMLIPLTTEIEKNNCHPF